MSPSPRLGPAMATYGDQLVLFGGQTADGNTRADTWLLTPTTWQQMTTDPSPIRRKWAELEWDPGRQQAVMFGGYGQHRACHGTWVLAPTGSPSGSLGGDKGC